MFKRYIRFTNGGNIAVVAIDSHGSWIDQDKLDYQTDFTWQINGNKLVLKSANGSPKFNKAGSYEYLFNLIPSRPASRQITSRFNLKEEMIIYQLGQFLKVSGSKETELLKHYNIR